jgi:hypothetical protein
MYIFDEDDYTYAEPPTVSLSTPFLSIRSLTYRIILQPRILEHEDLQYPNEPAAPPTVSLSASTSSILSLTDRIILQPHILEHEDLQYPTEPSTDYDKPLPYLLPPPSSDSIEDYLERYYLSPPLGLTNDMPYDFTSPRFSISNNPDSAWTRDSIADPEWLASLSVEELEDLKKSLAEMTR